MKFDWQMAFYTLTFGLSGIFLLAALIALCEGIYALAFAIALAAVLVFSGAAGLRDWGDDK